VLDAMARVLMLKDRPKEASGLLRLAVRARPAYAPLYVSLAGAHRAAGETARAREALEIALELDPFLESAYQALAALATSEDGKGAERLVWRRYLERAPNNLRARKGAE
jgi:predicted Zn-dependent protease